jgi:hypothetical protein
MSRADSRIFTGSEGTLGLITEALLAWSNGRATLQPREFAAQGCYNSKRHHSLPESYRYA